MPALPPGSSVGAGRQRSSWPSCPSLLLWKGAWRTLEDAAPSLRELDRHHNLLNLVSNTSFWYSSLYSKEVPLYINIQTWHGVSQAQLLSETRSQTVRIFVAFAICTVFFQQFTCTAVNCLGDQRCGFAGHSSCVTIIQLLKYWKKEKTMRHLTKQISNVNIICFAWKWITTYWQNVSLCWWWCSDLFVYGLLTVQRMSSS